MFFLCKVSVMPEKSSLEDGLNTAGYFLWQNQGFKMSF